MSVATSSAAAAAVDPNGSGPWACTTCTYVNPDPLHLACEVCGELRAESTDLEQYQEQKETTQRTTITKTWTEPPPPASSRPADDDAPSDPPCRSRRAPAPRNDDHDDDLTSFKSRHRRLRDMRNDGTTTTTTTSIGMQMETPSPNRTTTTTSMQMASTAPETKKVQEDFEKPGAYAVIQHENKIERQTMGFISPHDTNSTSNHSRERNNNVEEDSLVNAQEEKEQEQDVPNALPETTVVEAEVVTDEALEQEIRERLRLEQQNQAREEEEAVRQRILQEAVQAEVVTTDTYTTTTTTTDPEIKPNNFKEHLFGTSNSRVDIASTPEAIRTRQLLPWNVYRNETTKMWIASVQTQNGARTNLSFKTQHEAERVGLQMAPPRIMPFEENKVCYVCQAMFAVFKRPCHCRNCGVCICSSCTVSWSSKMVPETYNIKNNSSVKVCLACDWLSLSFHSALTRGEYSKVKDLYKTGNLNLSTPFCNVKGELFYPVHCAVLGGNLKLLKWLVEEQCCSIQADSKNKSGPLLTSKGRSLLGMAQSSHRIDFIRYLIIAKGMSLSQERDLDVSITIANFTNVLGLLPENIANESAGQQASASR